MAYSRSPLAPTKFVPANNTSTVGSLCGRPSSSRQNSKFVVTDLTDHRSIRHWRNWRYLSEKNSNKNEVQAPIERNKPVSERRSYVVKGTCENVPAMADRRIKLLLISLAALTARVQAILSVNLTFIDTAVGKGAVCLDGSPPAYAYVPGFGSGSDNWLVYLEGGAWCATEEECLKRQREERYGSSLRRNGNATFLGGMLDTNQTYNPDFYNWNKVYALYCDGSSFTGDVEDVDPQTGLYYRGSRVFAVIMDELLAKGMINAENAILAGGSAGGVATILHCDGFRELLPTARRLKCVSDSGFFLHAKQHPLVEAREQRFANVVELHGMAQFLPESCTSRMDPRLCMFPENLVGSLQTPIFLLESAFDAWQIANNFDLGGDIAWQNCLLNLTLCTHSQLETMKDFRVALMETLQGLGSSSSRGMFVDSCFNHGHIYSLGQWSCSSASGNILGNKTIAQAIGDWYFDRSSFQEIDAYDLPRNCHLAGDQIMKKCFAS